MASQLFLDVCARIGSGEVGQVFPLCPEPHLDEAAQRSERRRALASADRRLRPGAVAAFADDPLVIDARRQLELLK